MPAAPALGKNKIDSAKLRGLDPLDVQFAFKQAIGGFHVARFEGENRTVQLGSAAAVEVELGLQCLQTQCIAA